MLKEKLDDQLMLEISKAALSNAKLSYTISKSIRRLYKYSIILESGECSDYYMFFESFIKEFSEFMLNTKNNFESLSSKQKQYYKSLIIERIKILEGILPKSKKLLVIEKHIQTIDDEGLTKLLEKTFLIDELTNTSFLNNIDSTSLEKNGYHDLDREVLSKNILTKLQKSKIDDVKKNKISSKYIYDMYIRSFETCIYNQCDIEHIHNIKRLKNDGKVKTKGTKN